MTTRRALSNGYQALFVVLIVALVLGAGFIATSSPNNSSSVTSTTGTDSMTLPSGSSITHTIMIHVLNESTPGAVYNGSVRVGPASSPNDVAFTPGGGPTVKECVYQVGNGSTIEANGTVVSGTATYTIPPCPLKSYATNSTGWVTISNATGPYYFIVVGNFQSYNYAIVDLGENRTLYVTIPWPSGVATVSGNPPNATGQQVTGQVYKVTFQQAGQCTPSVYVAPWAVTLANETEVEPSIATLPISAATWNASHLQYTIVFSVPDRRYNYTTYVAGTQPDSGTVVVSGSDVTVNASAPPVMCVVMTGQASAIKLNLNLSETVTASGSALSEYGIRANVSEYNTLPAYNNVSMAQNWPTSKLSLGACGSNPYPMGIAVYEGRYTSQNISAGTPLTTSQPGIFNGPVASNCPAMFQVLQYDFAPSSSTAIVTYACTPSCTRFPTYQISDSVSITGYWSVNASLGVSAFHRLSAGVYTVVAGDEWGNMALEYIVVK